MSAHSDYTPHGTSGLIAVTAPGMVSALGSHIIYRTLGALKEHKLTDRWQKSRAMLTRAQASLAGGVSSPFRAKFPVPLYFTDGCGSRLRDVDGNEYIDYALA